MSSVVKTATLEKLSALKHSRNAEEQLDHLEPVSEKYSALQSHVAALKTHYEERIRELEKGSVLKNQEQSQVANSTEEGKKIMNGVFQSLRREFELEESYSGRTVLGVVMNMIKTVTLQLLRRQQKGQESNSEEDDEEEPGVRRQGSPPSAKEDCEGPVPHGPTPRTVCLTEPAGNSSAIAAAAPLSPEEGQGTRNDTASEVKRSQVVPGEHASPELVQPIKPDQGLVVPEQPVTEEDAAFVLTEQRQAGASGRIAECDENHSQKVASVQAETLETKLGTEELARPSETPAPEHKAEEPAGGVESAEGGKALAIPAAPSSETSPGVSDFTPEMAEKGPATENKTAEPPGLASGPTQDSSLSEGTSDMSRGTACKPLKPGVPSEEDDEEEVSMKGRPPPTPLFGDDDDDDDLDWLG